MEFRVLELFSGIGGMHYAFKHSQLVGDVVAAVDINTVANDVYKHNHPATRLMNNNIQCLDVRILEKLAVNMVLMSPPCQPHTRVGNQRDVNDHRSDALLHLCTILPSCSNLSYVLMENVKGFEHSESRKRFVEAMQAVGFHWREFILSPTQFGVPNTRHRYYYLGRKGTDFEFDGNRIWETLGNRSADTSLPPSSIDNYLQSDNEVTLESYVPDKILKKYVRIMDIVTRNATNTMCFTKAYTHYSEGTGSVYSMLNREHLDSIFEEIKSNESNECDCRELLRQLKLRYFTPREVARLMSFPESFDFPAHTTNRQRYRLLGNSINVRVVGELIKILCS